MECYTDEQFGTDRGEIVWLVQAVSCIISLFGSCFILVNYFVLSQGKNPLVKLVALLTLGDLGWIVIKLIHFTLNRIDYGWTGDCFYGCVAIRLAWQFFAATSILWTCCISIFLYKAVVRKEKTSRRLWLGFHFVSWGLPLLLVIALAAGGDDTMKHSVALGTCYPIWYLHIFLWFLPVMMAFLFNLILYVIVAWNVRRTLKLIHSIMPKRTHFVYRKFTFYILVYIVCWPLDIVNSFIHYSQGTETRCHYFALVCIYSALLNSQGFLNFLVYGLTNKKISSQFFGRDWRQTVKAIGVFFASPVLLLPVVLWYGILVPCCKKSSYASSLRSITKEEALRQQKIEEARRLRQERSKKMVDQIWGNTGPFSPDTYAGDSLPTLNHGHHAATTAHASVVLTPATSTTTLFSDGDSDESGTYTDTTNTRERALTLSVQEI